MSKKIVVLLFSCIILLLSCNTTEPPVPPPPEDKPTLKLELDDAQCTETWIKFTSTKLQLPGSIILKQYNPNGDSISTTINLITPDTLFYIDSLLPNQTYSFHSIIQPYNHTGEVKSNVLSVTTMDTTSHSFTWQMFTFGGDIGSSVLNDVAIIDENNIWAVGEIWIVDDTSSLGYTKYNAVHWDGSQWELKRILYATSFNPIYAIFAFDSDDIWFGIGSMIHWNGTEYRSITTAPAFPSLVNKIWGTSSNDLYIVGNSGNIAHYNGQIWSQIESGTELNINDIWGDYNEKTGEWEILAVASNYGTSFDKEILQIKKNNVVKLSTNSHPNMEPLLTTWFISNRQYYVAGAGIYQKRLLSDNFWKHNLYDITTFATTSIRGNTINDVIGVGAFGDLVHFNGVSWKNDYEQPNLSNGSYGSVTVKAHIIAATGLNNREAVVLIGRR